MPSLQTSMNRRTRRQFLQTVASLTSLLAATANDIPSPDGDCMVPLNPLVGRAFPMNSLRTIDPPGHAGFRPLWSELGRTDRKHYLKQLKTAYQSYVERKTESGCLNQMRVHDLFCGAGTQRAMDTANDTSGFDIHENYFFLPWHRAFLYFHERVLQSFLPRNPEFRLPVYDWENVKGQDLPVSYSALPRPNFQCSESKSRPAFSPCYMQGWLVSDNVRRFVGGAIVDKPVQSAQGPHSAVHGQLKGLMADMATSAADPVFWAHHANIDRYWDYWATQYKNQHWFKDQYKWPEGYFYFYDKDDSLVRISICQMLEPEQLGYRYTSPIIPIASLVPAYLNLTSIDTNGLAALLITALMSVLSTTTSDVRSALSSLARGLDPKTQGDIRYYANNVAQISQQTLDILIQLFLVVYRFAPKTDLSLPTVITGNPTTPVGPGYYIVDITDGSHYGRVGGFSVLTMQPAPYVSIACMSADALKIIADNYQNPNRLSLVYGLADFTGEAIQGTPKPFPMIQSHVNLPAPRASLLG